MRSPGIAFLVLSSAFLLIAPTGLGSATAGKARPGAGARLATDGHLRVGRLETIRVKGLPGKGTTAVAFFPTAICEDGCGARSLPGGRTDAHGAARFRVRVPGTFLDLRNRPVYYRDGERVDVELSWEGADGSFAHISSRGEPVIVRIHGGSGG